MLLSRVADSLYWIGRYLERAEHTARLVDIAVEEGLGRGSAREGSAVDRLYRSIGLALTDDNSTSLPVAALFDLDNHNSVVSCVTAARENARQVREEISSAMWQLLNELHLRVRQMREDGSWARTHAVSRAVINGVRLFKGTTDGTMGHGEGWQYLQVGRFLERAGATAAQLNLFVPDEASTGNLPEPLDRDEWVTLLQSCYALEPYCRHYTADVRQERVVEFLLLNPEFPRSVCFSAARLDSALQALASFAPRVSGAESMRLSGRLRASLGYAQVEEILRGGPHAYLSSISQQCAQIHAAVHECYVGYPIESALPA